MSIGDNLFWDSCVFIRWLTKDPTDLVLDINQFIDEAKENRRTIYYSTLIYAEISPKHLRDGGYGTINDLIEDLEGAFEPIDPNPNILMDVAVMRSRVPFNPKKPAISKLTLGTPDAIHLASCLYVRDVLGISDITLQTFDKTVSSGWEGKTVPIIGIEGWYESHLDVPQIAKMCSLPRCLPQHPQLPLFLSGVPNAPPKPPPSEIHVPDGGAPPGGA